MPSLKLKSDFQHLKKEGQFFHVTHWLAVSVQKNSVREMRWAWTVSKKIGNAVTRNRLKRWGREFIREHGKHEIDINFIFKIKSKEFYKSLSRDEFDRAFSKVIEKTG